MNFSDSNDSHLTLSCCLAIIFIGSAQCQRMTVTTNGTGICKGGQFRYLAEMKRGLEGCVVIVGYLELVFRTRENNFSDTQFPDLREITEYLVIYNVNGLESVSQVFPALTRIRGNKLFYSYALIVYDNPNLREIALYNLLKIDRGGIIMWALPQACYVDTIDWKVLAPKARRVISPSEGHVECNVPCNCDPGTSKNRCWNNKKCQLFVKDENCHDQCLGCRKTAKDICFTCLNYNYQFKCVNECPSGTIVLPDNNYCITRKECVELDRFVLNNTCVAECPTDYKYSNRKAEPTCEPCIHHCDMNCSSLSIHSLGAIQNAEKCVYINGSLILRLRYITDAMDELKKYLNKIEVVSDFILIESSTVITSLDFLPSLRVIKGNRLKDNKYSLYINDNFNLHTLFTPEVTKRLQIKNGTVGFQENPVLCMNIIDEIKTRFPTKPNEFDIPLGSNGYRGGCKEVSFNFSIVAISKTYVQIRFPIEDYNTIYTALYVRVPPGIHSKVVPETCCNFEWRSADVVMISGKNFSHANLKELVPASTYAFCIEIYNSQKNLLSRSNIVNFTTPVGTPEPPFILELIADSSSTVVIRWTDHENYTEHIRNYELDVELLEMSPKESMIDYCEFKEDFFQEDDIRHTIVRRPPPAYKRDCETMCGKLASATPGAMAEEYFDVCGENFHCTDSEENIIKNSTTVNNYTRTLSLKLKGPISNIQVAGLAPYSDYKFRLRVCIDLQCSRSARGIVRTQSSNNVDIISGVVGHADALGILTVKWETPKISNGPILSYFIEVIPRLNISNIIPVVVCVRANETMATVKSVITSKYLVKVCLRSLAPSRSCTDVFEITAPSSSTTLSPSSPTTSKMYLLWTSVLCGILMYIATVLVGCLRIQRKVQSDRILLVDVSSYYHVESEAPVLMFNR